MASQEILSPYFEKFRERPLMPTPPPGVKNKDPRKKNLPKSGRVELAKHTNSTIKNKQTEEEGFDPTSAAVRPKGA